MNERIMQMAELCKKEDIYPKKIKAEYNPWDVFESDAMMAAIRLSKYMSVQTVKITDNMRFVGLLKFDGSVPSEYFMHTGAKRFNEEQVPEFYTKYYNNLVTLESTHSVGDFSYLINNGIDGWRKKIALSLENHKNDENRVDYLNALLVMCQGIEDWANRCADACYEMAKTKTGDRKKELHVMGDILRKVPLHKSETFREAIQVLFLAFHFLPDSIGTIDRYLKPFYDHDISKGMITRDEAKEMLQELFVMINGWTSPTFAWAADRGAESHFAIGGSDLDGNDIFSDFSRLIVEAIVELPLYRPQISFRWTEKTPHEVFRFILDCERKDPYKRITIVSDKPRIDAFTNICKLKKEDAIDYTMVGCNEPAIIGSVWRGGCTVNIARSLTDTLYGHSDECILCKDFDSFYKLYEKQLESDLLEIMDTINKFLRGRAKDENVLSSLLMRGSIEKAISMTKGGTDVNIGGANLMGLTCVIDSLCIIKQFVFDEKKIDFEALITAIKSNWENYEDLRITILNTGKFFGNNEELSNQMAQRFTTSIWNFTHDKTNIYGGHYIFGTLSGYQAHYARYGEFTSATPDGRFHGDPFMVGVGQTNGKDRDGLTSLISSVSQMDPKNILAGPTVFNVMIDEVLMKKDENFEKTVSLFETYFRMGGLHIQLNYVSKKELLAAKKQPENYGTLRVRVSGFSGYFVLLNEDIQNNILARTSIAN